MKNNQSLLNLRRSATRLLAFLFLTLLGLGQMWAATEAPGATGTSNVDLVGTSFTIQGTYVAGAGGASKTPMKTKGVKFRTNRYSDNNKASGTANTIEFLVNDGYKITRIDLCGITNTDSKAATIGSLSVDGESVAFTAVELAAKNASAATTFSTGTIDAREKIDFTFSNLNGTNQANIEFTITYEVLGTLYDITFSNGGHGVAPSNASLVTVALPTLAENGWNNTGWTANQDVVVDGNTVTAGTTIACGKTATPSAATTFTAQWEEFPCNPVVTYDAGCWASQTLTANTTYEDLTIAATSSKSVIIDASEKTIDEKSFTKRFRTNGVGTATSNTLAIHVDGPCYVDVYLGSASSDDRTLNAYATSWGNGEPVMAFTAPGSGSNPTKVSQEYRGSEANLVFGSASGGGINVYGIDVTPIVEDCTAPTIAWNVQPQGGEVGDDDVVASVVTNQNDAVVTWESSNEEVATVSNGTIHFVGAGTTTITAKYTGSDDFCEREVKVQQDITILAQSSLVAHTPGIYEKATTEGGYGIDLVEYNDNKYEVYYFSATGSYGSNIKKSEETRQYRLMAADTNSEYILFGNANQGTSDPKYHESCSWIEANLAASGFAKSDYTYGSNTFEEFFHVTPNGGNASYTKTCMLRSKEGDELTLKISGYTEFALLASDNGTSKYLKVTVDGGDPITWKSTTLSRRSIPLTSGTHTIVIACVGTSQNSIYGFSLKLPNLPNAETPTITTQPASANYVDGDEIAALTVVASVSDGTLHYQWMKKGSPDTEVGEDAASFTPTVSGTYYVNVTNVLANHNDKTVKSDEATVTIVVPQYNVTFNVDGEQMGETQQVDKNGNVVAPANPTKDGYRFLGWSTDDTEENIKNLAEYAITKAENFQAIWQKATGVLIKATLKGNTSADVEGVLMGSADVKTQSDKKFGSGSFVGLRLADGQTFNEGDILNVNITAVSQAGSIKLYQSDKSTVIWDSEVLGVVGDNKIVLPAAVENLQEFYICRTSDNGWNAYVAFISVTRPRDILSQNYWGVKKDGASLSNPEDYTWNEGVVTMNELYKSVAAPEDYTWTNHITYEGNVTEDVNVPVEFDLNGNFWEATKEFDDQTVTIKVPVDKTLNVYVHFVEDWNGTTVWGAIADNWSDLSSSTETIGGATWYKMTYNNVAATDLQISNGNGANSVVFNVAADKTDAVYYIAYNSWDGDNFRVAEVADPTRKSINVYFQNPGWPSVSDFKMWVEDGVNGANVYGTTADYEFTSHVTYAGETWYNATVHYFGDNCTIYPKFKENTVQWESSAGIAGNTANVYIYYNSFAAQADETNKTFNAGVATNMLYAVGEGTAATDVTTATTWDWSTMTTTKGTELNASTYPTNTTEFLMSKLADNGEFAQDGFDFAALTVIAQFPCREAKYFQGNSIKFTTTIPGTVTVYFSNTSNRSDSPANRRFLYVNDVNTNVYTLNSDFISASAHVSAGEVVITAKTGEENETMIRVQKIVFTPDYSAPVTAGKYGTICMPYAVAANARSGAVFYNIESKNAAGNGIIIAEEEGALVAGKPYIYYAEEEGTMTLTFSGAKVNAPVSAEDANGLVGYLEATENVAVTSNTYFLKNNTLYHYTGENTTVTAPANKAFISWSAVPDYVAPVVEAPRRVIYIENVTDTATGLDNLNAAEQVKFIQNGVLYIRVADRLFDATGRLVK